MDTKLKECPFCGGDAVESLWPEGVETGKVFCPGHGNKQRDIKWGYLRDCPIEEVEFDKEDWEHRSTIAPPVAAGSVDAMQRYDIPVREKDLDDGMVPSAEGDYVLYSVAIALGAQQREAQQEENNGIMRDWAQRVVSAEERAEKAEAELETWAHTNRIDELQRSLLFAGNRIQDLESQLSAAKPYDLKA